MKKVLLSFGLLAAAVIASVGVSAFEAHIVNVTATIENALSVPVEAIDFGTVFPQEHLEQSLSVALSGSFLAEDRVDDVEYFIRQKPKCGITTENGTVLDHDSTQTGHVIVGDNPATQDVEKYWIDCGTPSRELEEGETYGMLPMLCPYISKHPDNSPLLPDSQVGNDGSLNSFHQPFYVGDSQLTWNDTVGRLAKSEQDIKDDWTIDLAVPCFGGQCAQDWADFVHGFNPDADPNAYTQDTSNEHKVFGCDLWVEVSGVSEAATSTIPQ